MKEIIQSLGMGFLLYIGLGLLLLVLIFIVLYIKEVIVELQKSKKKIKK